MRSALLFLACVAMFAQERVFTIEDVIDIQVHNTTEESWSGDKLFGVDTSRRAAPIVFTIDRDGRLDDFIFTLPGLALWDLHHWAASPKGEILLAGSSPEPKFQNFLALVGADHQTKLIVPTPSFIPQAVTLGPNGSLWAINDGPDGVGLLRIYSRDGRLLVSRTIQLWRPDYRTGPTYLTASRDRVAWYTNSGEYFEFGLDGRPITHMEGAKNISGFAISQNNEAIASIIADGETEFRMLSRTGGGWMRVSYPEDDEPAEAKVIGFDGDTLIASTHISTLIRIVTGAR